jgi:hypothetical protein
VPPHHEQKILHWRELPHCCTVPHPCGHKRLPASSHEPMWRTCHISNQLTPGLALLARRDRNLAAASVTTVMGGAVPAACDPQVILDRLIQVLVFVPLMGIHSILCLSHSWASAQSLCRCSVFTVFEKLSRICMQLRAGFLLAQKSQFAQGEGGGILQKYCPMKRIDR